MHALVAAVLLRLTGCDALDLDSEAQPPDGERGESEESLAGSERRTVIGADGIGQSEVLEGALEYGKREL